MILTWESSIGSLVAGGPKSRFGFVSYRFPSIKAFRVDIPPFSSKDQPVGPLACPVPAEMRFDRATWPVGPADHVVPPPPQLHQVCAHFGHCNSSEKSF